MPIINSRLYLNIEGRGSSRSVGHDEEEDEEEKEEDGLQPKLL